jgi:hypothetical protein
VELTKGRLATLVMTVCNQRQADISFSKHTRREKSQENSYLKILPVGDQLQQTPLFLLVKKQPVEEKFISEHLGLDSQMPDEQMLILK